MQFIKKFQAQAKPVLDEIKSGFGTFAVQHKEAQTQKAKRVYPNDPALQAKYVAMYAGPLTIPAMAGNFVIRRSVRKYAKEHGWSWKRRFVVTQALQMLNLTLIFGTHAARSSYVAAWISGQDLHPKKLKKVYVDAKAAHEAKQKPGVSLDWRDATEADLEEIEKFLTSSDANFLFGDPEQLQQRVQEMLGDQARVTVRKIDLGTDD